MSLRPLGFGKVILESVKMDILNFKLESDIVPDFNFLSSLLTWRIPEKNLVKSTTNI